MKNLPNPGLFSAPWRTKRQNPGCSAYFAGIHPWLILAGLLIPCGNPCATAQTMEVAQWTSGDGVFETPSKWNTGSVPGAEMVAVFAPEGPLTVTLSADTSLGGLDNQGTSSGDEAANLILELGGHTLAIGGEEVNHSTPPISLGAYANSGPRILTFRNGRINCSHVVLNNPVNSEWSRMVVGEGAEMDAAVTVGNNEKGELYVESGGRWISRAPEIYIGRVGLSSEGKVKITGKDSSWQALGKSDGTHCQVGVGASGSGSLEITQGGKMMAFIVQLAGHQAHLETPAGEGRGHVKVEGSDSEMECAFLYVGGGRVVDTGAAAGGAGTVEIADGGVVKCGLLRAFPHSTLTFRGGCLEQTGHFRETAVSEQSVLEPASVLHFVLEKAGGPAPLSAENLKIDGALLDIELAEGFSPRVGDEFPLLSASGALEGNFAGIKSGDKLQAGGHAFTIDYGSQGTGPIVLKAVQAK